MSIAFRTVACLVSLACLSTFVHADSITTGTTTVGKKDANGNVNLVTVNTTTATFGFEQISAGAILFSGSTLTLTNGAGTDFQIRISRPGSVLGFTDLSAYVGDGVPADWGSTTLDPFYDYSSEAPILFEVTGIPIGQSVLRLNIEVGDFGPSDNDRIFWDGGNAMLDNLSDPGFSMLSLSGIQNSSLSPQSGPVYDFAYGRGGASFLLDPSDQFSFFTNNTLFWDNFSIVTVDTDDLPDSVPAPAFVFLSDNQIPGYIPNANLPGNTSPIPEPGSLLLCAAGVAGIALLRRRKRDR